MVKNIVLFILNADGSYKVAPIGTIRANSRNSCLIGVLAPTPHDNIVQVGYSIQDSVDIQVSQFLDLSTKKGADIISPQASYFDDVKEWHYWESNISPQALSYVSKHRGGKTGISITISEREIPKEATNYKGYFGYQPLPPTANNGDFYECDKNDTVAFGYTFAKGDIAYYLYGWQQSRLYAVMTTSTEPIPIEPNITVGKVDDVGELAPIYERLGDQQNQINGVQETLNWVEDTLSTHRNDLDKLELADTNIRASITEVNDKIGTLQEKIEDNKRDIDELKDGVSDLENEVDNLILENEDNKNRLDEVEQKASVNEDEIVNTNERIDTLDSQKLNKVWTDLENQTTVLLKDKLVVNRGGAVFQTTIETLINAVQIPSIFEITDVRPEVGLPNKIYVIPNDSGTFNEYIWVNNDWESLGLITIDLSNYYTIEEVDNTFLLYVTKTALQTEITRLNSEINTLKMKDTDHSEEIYNLKDKDEILEELINDNVSRLDESIDDIQDTLNNNEEVLSNHRSDIDKLKQDDITIKASITTLETETNNKITALQNKATTHDNEIADLKQADIQARELITEVDDKVGLLQERIDTNVGKIDDLENEIVNANERIDELINAIPITYQELVSLINANALTPNAKYLITDYQTIYIQPETDIVMSGDIEPIVVTAFNENTLLREARSTVYKDDILHYDIENRDWTPSTGKGTIVRRIDSNNNSLPYDHEAIKFRRYAIDETIIQPHSASKSYNQFDFVVLTQYGTKKLYICKNNISAKAFNDSDWMIVSNTTHNNKFYIGYASWSRINYGVNTKGDVFNLNDFIDCYTFTNPNLQKMNRTTGVFNNHFTNVSYNLPNSVFFNMYVNQNEVSSGFFSNTIYGNFIRNQINCYFEDNLLGNFSDNLCNNGDFGSNTIANCYGNIFLSSSSSTYIFAQRMNNNILIECYTIFVINFNENVGIFYENKILGSFYGNKGVLKYTEINTNYVENNNFTKVEDCYINVSLTNSTFVGALDFVTINALPKDENIIIYGIDDGVAYYEYVDENGDKQGGLI